jgi:ubiquinone biosynthesis protein UbiJ
MLTLALLAAAEHGLNRVLRLDSTALPRLAALSGKVIAIHCPSPTFELFLLPSADGLRLASSWAAAPDCLLRAPAASLLRLATSQDKSGVLHQPEFELHGDSAALLALVGVLQDLELDWEYELARVLGPVGAHLLGSRLRGAGHWSAHSLGSMRQNLADYLAEESRSLVGQREAETRFRELDEVKLTLERLEARVEHLAKPNPSENA